MSSPNMKISLLLYRKEKQRKQTSRKEIMKFRWVSITNDR